MFNVLSFDSARVHIGQSCGGNIVVKKRTSEKEFLNLSMATHHLEKHGLSVVVFNENEPTQVRVAPLDSWSEETSMMSTLFCKGENLESILREEKRKDRGTWISVIRALFVKFQRFGFMWGDFAPRNIIWNSTDNRLWLVDFERDTTTRDCPVEQGMFNRYIRSYSREEFACFLTEDEQLTVFKGFIQEPNGQRHIPIDHITSKRKSGLLRRVLGEKQSYSIQEVRTIEDLMVFIATPFFVRGNLFFPMDPLDSISSKRGPNEYVNTVIAIRDLDGPERFAELTRISRSFQQLCPNE